MKRRIIIEIAKKMNVNFENMDKVELIRAIQRAEGNLPCYATQAHECDQINCLWREDCVNAVASQKSRERRLS